MRARINITAQVQENYGTEKNPYWKNIGTNLNPKGVRDIITTLDSDAAIYSDPEAIVSAMEALLESLSSPHYRYLFVDYTLSFIEPIIIEGDALDKLVQQEIEQVFYKS